MSNQWYRLDNILSRDMALNFVVSYRSAGKTYACKEKGIKAFIRDNTTQWILLRRYESELLTKDEFLTDISKQFPDYDMKVNGFKMMIRHRVKQQKDEDGNNVYIDCVTGEKASDSERWECMGFLLSLSTYQNYKGTSFDNVGMILFDEFIKEDGHTRYLPNEVNKLLNLYDTVDRDRELYGKRKVVLIACANAISIQCPYFAYYKISVPKLTEQQFVLLKDHETCFEFYTNDARQFEKQSSVVGKAASSSDYMAMAINNQFKDAHSLMTGTKSGQSNYNFSFVFYSNWFSVWFDRADGLYYIEGTQPKGENGIKSVFVLTKDDMQPNMIMIEKTAPIMRDIKRMMQYNCVRFDNAITRERFFDMLNLI